MYVYKTNEQNENRIFETFFKYMFIRFKYKSVW